MFRTEAIEQCIVADLGETGALALAIGVDWAKARDWTAFAVVSGTKERCALVEAGRVPRGSWDAIVGWVQMILGRYPGARVLCDGTGLGSPLIHNLRNACPQAPIAGLEITAQNKPDLIGRLVALFENRRIRMQRNPELVLELQNFEMQEGQSGHTRLAAGTGHDDLVIALALAVAALPTTESPRIVSGAPRRFF